MTETEPEGEGELPRSDFDGDFKLVFGEFDGAVVLAGLSECDTGLRT